MRYLLDANICIYLINGTHSKIATRLQQHPADEVVISSIVVSELMFGVENSSKPIQNRAKLDRFLAKHNILMYGLDDAIVYGTVRAHLKRTGQKIGAVDTFIAAHALANELVLVTNNTREFSRVPNLKLEDWTQ